MAENWKVTNQRQTTMQTTGGQWVDAMRIEFETTAGVSGHLEVPLNQYGAAHVRELLNARTAQIDEIHDL